MAVSTSSKPVIAISSGMSQLVIAAGAQNSAGDGIVCRDEGGHLALLLQETVGGVITFLGAAPYRFTDDLAFAVAS